MNAQRANEIEVLLEGVPLPASRDMLVHYAAPQDEDAAALLRQLPDREYDRLDLVGELLRGVVPAPAAQPATPTAESGDPPGGDQYVQAFPQPGAVRDSEPPSDVLEQQTKTQKRQQAKQDEG